MAETEGVSGGWRLVVGRLDRLEKVVSVADKLPPADSGCGFKPMAAAARLPNGDAEVARGLDGECVATDAAGGLCWLVMDGFQGEAGPGEDEEEDSGSMRPRMLMLRGGKLLGDSFLRELGRGLLLNSASAENGEILAGVVVAILSVRGVTLRPPPVLRSRLPSPGLAAAGSTGPARSGREVT